MIKIKVLKEFGKATHLTKMVGDSLKPIHELRSHDRNSNYKKLNKNENKHIIKEFSEIWAEGFNILFPDKTIIFSDLNELLNRLVKKINYYEVEKNINIEFFKKDLLNVVIICFYTNLKLYINQYPDYFEIIEDNILTEEIDTLEKVFDYIKTKEDKGALSNIFGKTDSQISKWKTNNLSLKSLLEIKNFMETEERKEYKIEQNKINTYILLIYIYSSTKVINSELEETNSDSNKINIEILIKVLLPFILFFSEEIADFFKKNNKLKKQKKVVQMEMESEK